MTGLRDFGVVDAKMYVVDDACCKGVAGKFDFERVQPGLDD